jgi:hypothetical protein
MRLEEGANGQEWVAGAVWAAASEEDGAWRGGRGGGEAGRPCFSWLGEDTQRRRRLTSGATPATNIRSDAGDQHPEPCTAPRCASSHRCYDPAAVVRLLRVTPPSASAFPPPLLPEVSSSLFSLFHLCKWQWRYIDYHGVWKRDTFPYLPILSLPPLFIARSVESLLFSFNID